MATDSKSHLTRVCLAAFALLAMTGVSVAQNVSCFPTQPPMRYWHEPTQPYTMQFVDDDTLQRTCGNNSAFALRVLGCAMVETGEIYILDDLPPLVKRCVIKHEKAHLNGWSHFHPIR